MGFAINQCDLCTGVLHQRVRIPLPESFMLPFSLIHMLPQQNIKKKQKTCIWCFQPHQITLSNFLQFIFHYIVNKWWN